MKKILGINLIQALLSAQENLSATFAADQVALGVHTTHRIFGTVAIVMALLSGSWLFAVDILHDRNKNEQSLLPVWSGFERQQISVEMTAENNHRWRSGFTLEAAQGQIVVSLNIKLIPTQDVKMLRLKEQEKLWLESIHNTWNNKFFLQISEDLFWPIKIKAKFTPFNPHHETLVRDGACDCRGKVDQNNWSVGTIPKIIAHEIGHMLGAYDEYRNGALSPQTQQIDNKSIMGSNPMDGRPYARHLDLVLDCIKKLTKVETLTIVKCEIKPNSGDCRLDPQMKVQVSDILAKKTRLSMTGSFTTDREEAKLEHNLSGTSKMKTVKTKRHYDE